MIAEGAFWELDAPVHAARPRWTSRSPSRRCSRTRPSRRRSASSRSRSPWSERGSDGDCRRSGRWRSTGSSGSTSTGCAASGSPARRQRLAESELGALLCFDMANIRYLTATHIGTWAMDKLIRFCLLPAGRRADHVGLRLGGAPPQALQPVARRGALAGRHLDAARLGRGAGRGRWRRRSASSSRSAASSASRSASTSSSCRCSARSRRRGSRSSTGRRSCRTSRMLKTEDEITLLTTACAMVDAAYEELFRAMRPGMRENECVALVNRVLYELGSEHVEGVNAISGERCSPHPHVFTDRMLRPGDPAYFDILHAFNGYRTCYYRTFAVGSASRAQVDAYKRCRDYPRPGDRADPAGRDDRGGRLDLAGGGGVRLPGRGGGVRAPVRARRRALDLGEADLQPPRLLRLSGDDRGGHGLRARDVLARRRTAGRRRGSRSSSSSPPTAAR